MQPTGLRSYAGHNPSTLPVDPDNLHQCEYYSLDLLYLLKYLVQGAFQFQAWFTPIISLNLSRQRSLLAGKTARFFYKVLKISKFIKLAGVKPPELNYPKNELLI
jgi:hypothetical protein